MPAPAPGRAKRAAQAAPAGALAPELLLLILAHLRTPAADLAIRASGAIPRVDRALAVSPRICRAWAAAATHELYAAVALPSVEAAARFLRTLRAHPALGARVRSIALPLCAACSSGGTLRPYARCPRISTVETASTLVARMWESALATPRRVIALRMHGSTLLDGQDDAGVTRLFRVVNDYGHTAELLEHAALHLRALVMDSGRSLLSDSREM